MWSIYPFGKGNVIFVQISYQTDVDMERPAAQAAQESCTYSQPLNHPQSASKEQCHSQGQNRVHATPACKASF